VIIINCPESRDRWVSGWDTHLFCWNMTRTVCYWESFPIMIHKRNNVFLKGNFSINRRGFSSGSSEIEGAQKVYINQWFGEVLLGQLDRA